ncbi:MAG: hypothetical protein ACLFM1_11150 [Bacteroidales bacterium]
MKKTRNLFFIPGLVIAMFSCDSKPEEAANESVEPNDKIEEANAIETGTEFSMQIHPKEDVDWYMMEAPGKGYIKVMSKSEPENLNVQVRFAEYDEWGEKKEKFLTPFLELPAAYAVHEADTFYAMVADRWNEHASEDTFKVKFEFLEEFDEYEPNNEQESAYETETGKTHKSAIFPKGEVDWFKMTTDTAGYIRVTAKDVPENLNLAVSFASFDEFDEEKSRTIQGKQELPQSVALPEPGEYYLGICDRWDENASEQLFTWKTEFIPEMDEYEPNNDYSQAKLVDVNDTIQLAIFPTQDEDIFIIHPEQSGVLSVMASKQENLEVAAGLYFLDEAENKLREIRGTDALPVKFDIEEADKDYYIQIQDRWNENADLSAFDLVLSFEPN